MNGLTEQLMAATWQQLCGHLLSVRKTKSWRGQASSWEAYVEKRWSLSKSRAKLYCDFATFCDMARHHMLRLPDSPDNLKPILALPQKSWMDTWQLCLQYGDGRPVTAQTCQATMNHFGIVAKRRIPEQVLKQRRLHKAASTMASFEDGEKLADELGANGFGRDWNKAVEVVVEAEQERMTLNGGRK